MAKYTVRKGRRYRASIRLGWAEQIASNDMIADRLRQAGFTEVHVTGSGRNRYAEALWPKEDATAEVPPQVVAVEEIGALAARKTKFVLVTKRRAGALSKAKREAAAPRRKAASRKQPAKRKRKSGR
ncbi:MAG TPA: hypothetical protein VNJ31_12485 [Methyloceanibacter sp.]|nr:hypothetical protein [Methyloceanibacter sp.]